VQSIGKSRGGRTMKVHLIAANARTALDFTLSPGQASDGPEGRKWLEYWDPRRSRTIHSVIMDRADEGNETRQLVFDLELDPVVHPKCNRIEPGEYNREMYKRRNEVERLFRRPKGFRRIFSRFEKLDVIDRTGLPARFLARYGQRHPADRIAGNSDIFIKINIDSHGPDASICDRLNFKVHDNLRILVPRFHKKGCLHVYCLCKTDADQGLGRGL
jgi:transposase